MISIGALVAMISMDVTAAMVAGGQTTRSWNVAGATATTPIVLTTTAPHGVPSGMKTHAVIAGVTGVLEANGNWELTVVDETRFSLGFYAPNGRPVSSSGTGSYAGGGTISTVLDQGQILLGRKYMAVTGAPPRVVFTPTTSPLFGLIPYGGAVMPLATFPSTLAQFTPEQVAMAQTPQVLTDLQRFEVYCYGAATPADPDFADFDMTRALRDQVIVSCMNLISEPMCKVLGGTWYSQIEGSKQAGWDSLGQAYQMLIEIAMPVIDKPFAFVPHGTHATLTVQPANPGPDDPIVIVT